MAGATLNPVADSWVKSSLPTNNFGTDAYFYVDGNGISIIFMKFDLSAYSGTLTSATLRVYTETTSGQDVGAYAVADTSWTETGLIWNNAPSLGSQLDTNVTTPSGYREWDVTAGVALGGLVTLALDKQGLGNTSVRLTSREGSNPPELVLVYTSGATVVATGIASAEAFGSPTIVGGSSTVSPRVSASGDDWQDYDGTFYDALTALFPGDFADVGFRWALNVPQGAVIDDAFITFTFRGAPTASAFTTPVAAVAEDDAAAATSLGDVTTDLASLTTASVNWTHQVTGSAGDTYDSPDLSTVVQEIVDRSGWAANQHIVLYVQNSGGSADENDIEEYDGDTAKAALLTVTYHIGGSAQTVIATGVASAEAAGSPTMAPGAVSAVPSGIASAEAIGSLTVAPGAVAAVLSGIASAEAVGSPTAVPGLVAVVLSGIASAEAAGSPVLVTGSVSLVLDGVASGEVFGSPVLALGAVALVLNGIASLEAVGSPSLVVGPTSLVPSGVASAEAIGSPTLSTGLVAVALSGIATAEAFGNLALVQGGVSLLMAGVATAEAFGSPTLSPGAVTVLPSSLATSEAFGTITALPGGVWVALDAIASAESVGSPVLVPGIRAVPLAGIASAEAMGSILLAPQPVSVVLNAVLSAEAFGSPTLVAYVGQLLSLDGVASAEAFGSATLVPGAVAIVLDGIASAEAFGLYHIGDAAGGGRRRIRAGRVVVRTSTGSGAGG